jgi:hypothetical protein
MGGRSPVIWFFLGTDYCSHKELQAGIGSCMQEVEFGGTFHETVNEFRQEYVDYIAALQEAEKDPLEKYSGFREKSPFISGIFEAACFIRLAKKILTDYPNYDVIIICQEKELACDLFLTLQRYGEPDVQLLVRCPVTSIQERFISFLWGAARIGNTARIIFFRKIRKPHTATVTSQRLKLVGSGQKTILIHTWMSKNSFSSGHYSESFYGDLQERLTNLGFDALLIPHIPYDIPFSPAVAALEKSGVPFVSEEDFLTIRSLIRIIGSCFLHLPRRREYCVGDVVITNTVYSQECRDWQNLQLLLPLQWEAIVKKFLSSNLHVRSLIILHENYSFEKAIIENFGRVDEGTTVIGYQHSSVASNNFSYCLSTSESDQVFLPDIVITNGTYPRELLIQNHYPADRVVVGGALRYVGTADLSPPCPNKGRTQKEGYIILTLPCMLDESIEILEKVYASLGDRPHKIIIKVHPFIPEDWLTRAVKKPVMDRFVFTREPLNQILPEAALLIYSNSSTCIDALLQGVPVLRILSDRRLDIDPLLDFRTRTPFIRVADHPDEIAHQIDELIIQEFSLQERDELARIVESIVAPVSQMTYTLFTFSKKYGDYH